MTAQVSGRRQPCAYIIYSIAAGNKRYAARRTNPSTSAPKLDDNRPGWVASQGQLKKTLMRPRALMRI
jgi:hypothetical protein